MTTNRELKNCPKCNSSDIDWDCPSIRTVRIRCKSCLIQYQQKYLQMTRDELLAKMIVNWNNRPADKKEGLVALDIMTMRSLGEEAVKRELKQSHNHKLIRIVCEGIYTKFGSKTNEISPLDENKLREFLVDHGFIYGDRTDNNRSDNDFGNVDIEKLCKELCSKFGTPKGVELDKNLVFNILHNIPITNQNFDSSLAVDYMSKESAKKLAKSICSAARKGELMNSQTSPVKGS